MALYQTTGPPYVEACIYIGIWGVRRSPPNWKYFVTGVCVMRENQRKWLCKGAFPGIGVRFFVLFPLRLLWISPGLITQGMLSSLGPCQSEKT